MYAGSAGSLLGVVRELPGEVSTVVLVGHNPGVEDLVAEGTGRSLPMPTSALAVIDLPGPWAAAGDATAKFSGHTGARPRAVSDLIACCSGRARPESLVRVEVPRPRAGQDAGAHEERGGGQHQAGPVEAEPVDQESGGQGRRRLRRPGWSPC